MTEPTDDLQQRCAEVAEWHRTGVLPGNALRNYAEAHWAGCHDSLQMAERDTSAQAMQWITKWGMPPAVAGEPECYRWERYDRWVNGCGWGTCESEYDPRLPENRQYHSEDFNDPEQVRNFRALYTTPQPTQAQAGAVQMTDWDMRGQLAASLHCWHRLTPNEAAELVAFFKRIAARGIKGGQHGAE